MFLFSIDFLVFFVLFSSRIPIPPFLSHPLDVLQCSLISSFFRIFSTLYAPCKHANWTDITTIAGTKRQNRDAELNVQWTAYWNSLLSFFQSPLLIPDFECNASLSSFSQERHSTINDLMLPLSLSSLLDVGCLSSLWMSFTRKKRKEKYFMRQENREEAYLRITPPLGAEQRDG